VPDTTRRSVIAVSGALALCGIAASARALSLPKPRPLPPDPAPISPTNATLTFQGRAPQEDTRFAGQTFWSVAPVTEWGRPMGIGLRADAEIPGRALKLELRLRRNEDPTLPVSHTIEVIFERSQRFAPGDVVDVPAVLMTEAQDTRGVRLAGISVKVTRDFFLVGLWETGEERLYNAALLKTRGWLDIEIAYADGTRAILSLEKGEPGASAFEAAFRAWGE
jgi:hypothetical protein